VVFSPDSKRLAAATSDGAIRILDIESLAELRRVPAVLPSGNPLWNPADPKQILVSNHHGYRIVNPETGEASPLVAMPNSAGWPVWHPEGRIIAFSAGNNTIRFWDPQRQAQQLQFVLENRPGGVIYSFNHAGDLLINSDWSGLWRLWDTRTGQQLLSLPASGNTLRFSKDDKRVAADTGSGKVRLFRVASGKEFRTLGGPNRFKYHDHGNAPIHGDGRLLAIRSQSHSGIVLVDTQRDEEVGVIPGQMDVVAF
jgi:WD40 repeat protein